jgi:uncharacterized membrane protein SpoIIM required for sporulation
LTSEVSGDEIEDTGLEGNNPLRPPNNAFYAKILVSSAFVVITAILGIFVFGFGTIIGRLLIGAAIGALANIAAKKERASALGFFEYSGLGALFVLFLFLVNGR